MKTDLNYNALLKQTLGHAVAYLDSLEEASVATTTTLEELRNRLSYPLNDDSLEPEKVIDSLVQDIRGGLLNTAGGRFYGWVIGGCVPAALAADWLTSTWDQNAALHATSPATAITEEIAGTWLKDLLGLPASASFAFVSGCQMAHMTGLAAARNFLLAKCGWDVEQQGLFGAPGIGILTSDQRHGTIDRTIRVLGFGKDSLHYLPLNEDGQLDGDALEKELEKRGDKPTIVLMQAGDINTGGYDDFENLIPLAHKYNAWVHVDGAFGLWVAASPKYRHLVKGVENADSWATDGHKWLNTPYDSGYAFVAHPEAHQNAMSQRASYLTHLDNARDQMDWNPEWSRRSRGVSTYAAIRSLGRKGIANLVEQTCRHAHDIVTGIAALDGAEMLFEQQINQGLLRFLDPRAGASEDDHDRYTDKVIEEINQTGEAFFTGTIWRGKRCMRVSVCGWLTSENDVKRTVQAAKDVLTRNRK